jgi:MFS family permease
MAPKVEKLQMEKGMAEVNRLLFWIKVVVFLDFFGVALVVPLLTSYFRDAGIDTKLLGVMSSLYSVSQIFGGIVMGILSDTQSKHDVLMLSLLGSAVSYFIVGSSKSVTMLFLSRILVGLVKQTYTIATTAINEITDSNPELRSQELGRLSAISTVSFIIGPSVGSILYSSVSKDAPAKVASLCFVLNAAVCIIFIPRTGIMAASSRKVKEIADEDTDNSSCFARFLSKPYNIFRSQLTDLAGIQNVLPVILMRLSIIFVESSMSSRNIVNYYENRFGIPTSALGFMQTATSGMPIFFFLITAVFSHRVQTNTPFNYIPQ